MSSWHIPEPTLRGWVHGRVDMVAAASVEQHLLGCPPCRAQVAVLQRSTPASGAVDLEQVWTAIADQVEPQPMPRLVRWLMRAGMRETDARLTSAAPALSTAWFTGLAVVLLFTVVASSFAPDRALVLFLMVAPLVPVAGVAAAYGADVDPTFELTLAAPYPKLRLLLLRTAAVAAGCVPLTVLAGLLVAGPWWVAVVWLLPALALVLLALAGSTFVPLGWATGGAAMAWLAVSVAPVVRQNPAALVDPRLLLGMGLLAALAGIVLATRLRHLATDWGIR